MPRNRRSFHLFLLVFSELLRSVDKHPTLICRNSQSLLFQILLLFLSSWCQRTFVVILQILDIPFCFGFFSQSVCFLLFCFADFCGDTRKLRNYSVKSHLLISPSKAFLISVTVVLISSIYFSFFLGISTHLSVYIAHLFLQVSTLSTGVFNIIIMVVFEFLV